jgi:hypothetical protein
MKLEDKIRSALRKKTIARPPERLQGVTKARIRQVLRALARETEDRIDVVFALLDDERDSWFTKAAAKGMKFSAGASIAHLACHVGLLQRKSGKLDREGRDYWSNPLWEIGAVERIIFDKKTTEFLPGHPVAKSPNSSYRIAPSFLQVLKASDADRPALLAAWMSEDATRARLKVQSELAKDASADVANPHKSLIAAATEVYVPKFLPGFEVLYVDAGDGDRVTDEDNKTLRKAGLDIQLSDSMPDVLLWNKRTDILWVIEAVTSDGEVDLHKVENLTAFAERYGKKGIGFTTAYTTWKEAAARQGKHKNIAPGTKIWIQEDGAKQLTVEAFESSHQRLGL